MRFSALEKAQARKPRELNIPNQKASQYFACDVFEDHKMREYLSRSAYEKVVEAIDKGHQIEREVADDVASSMKAWAIAKGATHYTHWFQPLTGLTAEKHDAFFSIDQNGVAIESFDGAMLVQQEPDASSFPTGGIRNTFEARGYTAWDPTSPAFIIGTTLCIPTIFVSYTGEALDYKTPLLKSINAIDKAAVDVCQHFDRNVEKVNTTLGWEQEYFLIDAALYHARPDLVLTGRTLFGRSSSKGHQLDDHYFGSIPERASAFIRDLEFEALKLGIPVKTRHNEVAPNQFECAPIFEEANLAVDHNQLLMDLMKKVASRHDLKVLLHEKPFAGINGSGKHCNWSLQTDKARNLLSPGKTPRKNLMFLTFFINTIAAVHKHADLIRAVIASAGNDHRLGANEAPPAIISVFVGAQLTEMLDEIERTVKTGKMTTDEKSELKLNIGKIPQILLDNTDRNRTSPFAFTGNKFEVRAVGASANCASLIIALNTIVAEQLSSFNVEVKALIKSGAKRDEAIFKVLRKNIIDSKPIRFDGNGYGQEWMEEAKKRGLKNVRTTPDALQAMCTRKVKKLYAEYGIMSDVELDARFEIEMEKYKMKVEIEARMAEELAVTKILPSVLKYQNTILNNFVSQNLAEQKSSFQKHILNEITKATQGLGNAAKDIRDARIKANSQTTVVKQASEFCNKVLPKLNQIRVYVDQLETLVDDSLWPLPKYRELLFTA